ncbi:hypothetical protein KCU64_g10420, partial [Aureobasidium melanogenum]
MVVFVDLDDPDEVEHQQHGHDTPFDMRELINAHAARSLQHTSEKQKDEEEDEDDREHPNLNALSAVLGNYPIISEIARHLDLNSLHDLSRTCRQFRANLLQHRRQLIPQTLRCKLIPNTTMRTLATLQHTIHPYTAAPAPVPHKSGSARPAPLPSAPSIPPTCVPGPGDPATARTSTASAQV